MENYSSLRRHDDLRSKMNNVTGRSFYRLRFGGTYSMESGYLGCDFQHANLYRGASVSYSFLVLLSLLRPNRAN